MRSGELVLSSERAYHEAGVRVQVPARAPTRRGRSGGFEFKFAFGRGLRSGGQFKFGHRVRDPARRHGQFEFGIECARSNFPAEVEGSPSSSSSPSSLSSATAARRCLQGHAARDRDCNFSQPLGIFGAVPHFHAFTGPCRVGQTRSNGILTASHPNGLRPRYFQSNKCQGLGLGSKFCPGGGDLQDRGVDVGVLLEAIVQLGPSAPVSNALLHQRVPPE